MAIALIFFQKLKFVIQFSSEFCNLKVLNSWIIVEKLREGGRLGSCHCVFAGGAIWRLAGCSILKV